MSETKEREPITSGQAQCSKCGTTAPARIAIAFRTAKGSIYRCLNERACEKRVEKAREVSR